MKDTIDDFAMPPATGKPAVAATLTLVVAASGIYFFVRDWAYFEVGQLVLIGIFLVSLVLLYFCIVKFRMLSAFFLVMLCMALIFASQEKYQWRREYITSGMAGKPFLLEAYIDHYPPLEEYLAAPYLEIPDWVRFSHDCIEPVVNNLQPGMNCTTTSRIKEAYNIDVRKVLRDYKARMAQTALRIERGQIAQKKRYERCIAEKQCAEVPLLPARVDPASVDPKSQDYIEIRRPFWQLINTKPDELTVDICEYMLLCRVLTRVGALNESRRAPQKAADGMAGER